MSTKILPVLLATCTLALTGCGKETQGTGAPAAGAAKVQYSPHLDGEHAPAPDDGTRPYYGDTHLHTSYSTDAGMVGRM